MAIIETNDIEIILRKFINDENIDVENIFTNQPDLFNFKIRYEKYKKSVNAPAAKIICEYQNFIYRLASYLKYANPDIRKLSQQEKEELEIAFEVNPGSSEITTSLINKFREVLKMIPEKQRGLVFIVLILSITGSSCYKSYLDQQAKKSTNQIIETAVNKIAESNSALIEILEDTERQILNTLPDIDENIEYQGEAYSKEELKNIKKTKYPRSKIEKKAGVLEGKFVVDQINIKNHYIIIENNEGDVEKIMYGDDLISDMQNFKDRFKQAIDDEGKVFYIRASFSEKNKKRGELILWEIKET